MDKNGCKMYKIAIDSKCEDEILLNLKIKLSIFLATLRLKWKMELLIKKRVTLL